MQPVALLDCAGRRRLPATLSSFHRGRPPRNKGLRYPPDPRIGRRSSRSCALPGMTHYGIRLRGVIVVLWLRRAPDQ